MDGEKTKRIRVLDKKVAELIAAGEVVERPASAVKELLENSIDAGASMITLEIKNGGVAFIRVTDNGCGIVSEDIPRAFLRHATSKIHEEDDLDAIGTLGFRGEALASISAVSKIEIITKTADELAGSHVRLEGGEIIENGDAGCPVGTTIIVKELFYNTPARMKFLKKDTTEGNAVAAVAQRIALSHPDVSFRFIKDGREDMHTPGDNKLISAVHSVLGREFAKSLIKADYTVGHTRAYGFVTKPLASRSNRNMQFFFLNGRFVKSRTMMAALDEAYKNSVMTGKYPGGVINLELDPSLVDVNVHPAKLEVRFTNEREVFGAVYYAAKNALALSDERPKFEDGGSRRAAVSGYTLNGQRDAYTGEAGQIKFAPGNSGAASHTGNSQILRSEFKTEYKPLERGTVTADEVAATGFADYSLKERTVKDRDAAPNGADVPHADKTADKQPLDNTESKISGAVSDEPVLSKAVSKEKVADDENVLAVGQVFGTYILAQKGDSLWIIDKHAAHERMLYEKVKKQRRASSQVLLEPVAVTLPADEYSAAVDNIDLLREAGIFAEDFGGCTLLVREAPLDLAGQDIESLVSEIAGLMLAHKKDLTPSRLDWIFHSVACRAAIKAHDKTALPEMQYLAQRVLCDNDILYCPHGRPVAYELPKSDLEKKFGR